MAYILGVSEATTQKMKYVTDNTQYSYSTAVMNVYGDVTRYAFRAMMFQ